MDAEVLPVIEHIEVLCNGEAQNVLCEKYSEDNFTFPEWFDEKKFKRGQKYIQDNIFSQFTCTLSGLICVLSIPTIIEVLVNTQRSTTVLSAYRRYLSTIFHVYCWYTQDLKPGTEAWKSLIAVRTRHFRSNTVVKAKGEGFISQRDLAFTQFGFFGLGLMVPEKIGMNSNDPEGIEGYVHFWRTIGYMIGIHDRYNLCRPSVDETKQVCEFVRNDIYCKAMTYPPEYFHFMIKSLVEGMWFYSPMLSEGSYLYFTFWLLGLKDYPFDFNMDNFSIKLLVKPDDNCTNNNISSNEVLHNGDMVKQLGWFNKFSLKLLMIIHGSWAKTNFGRTYFNGQTYLTLFLLKYFPFMSFMYLGIKNSFVNMFKEDIAIYAQPIPNKNMFALKHY